jgi:parallel beta-helix repeat protein
MKITKNALIVVFLTALHHAPSVFAQGQLTPPNSASPYVSERALDASGNPVPSMKTLMQIDPGEHLPSRDTAKPKLNGSLGHYELDQPGRYYLTENLDLPVVIAADNVTLDLSGFEIRYSGAGAGPVAIDGASGPTVYHRTRVMNGRIQGSWIQGALLGDDSSVTQVDVAGMTTYGIKLGLDGLVDQCHVRGPWTRETGGAAGPHSGIYVGRASVVTSCTATGIQGIGILGEDSVRIADCTVNEVAGCGIVAAHSASVTGCTVRECGSTGFDLNQGSALADSTAINNGDPGVHVRNGCTLINVTSLSNQDHGFWVENAGPAPGLLQNASRFVHCVAQSNAGDGFHVRSESAFKDCTADHNGSLEGPPGLVGNGFAFEDNCRLSDCIASNNALAGFKGLVGNTVDGCTASDNGGYGIWVGSDANGIIRNTLRGNGTGTVNPAPGSNGIAPLQAPATATNPFANFAL